MESRSFPNLNQNMTGEFKLASLECSIMLFSSKFKGSHKNLGGINL